MLSVRIECRTEKAEATNRAAELQSECGLGADKLGCVSKTDFPARPAVADGALSQRVAFSGRLPLTQSKHTQMLICSCRNEHFLNGDILLKS